MLNPTDQGTSSHPPDGGASALLWQQADTVATLLAMAPDLFGGVCLRAAPGPIRDHWLAQLKSRLGDKPFRRIPSHVTEAHLLGGLNLAATLRSGHAVAERGLLAHCHGGMGVLAMAERCQAQTIAHICQALDQGEITVQRDGVHCRHPAQFSVVALDEGLDDEHPATALTERLAFHIDLHSISIRDIDDSDRYHITSAAERYDIVTLSADHDRHIASAAEALGVESPRAWIFAVRTARALAALAGRDNTTDDDIAGAIHLCLLHRATRLPQSTEEQPPEQAPEEQQTAEQPSNPPDAEPLADEVNSSNDKTQQQAIPDQVLEATIAAIPTALLEQLKTQLRGKTRTPHSGVAGALQRQLNRGRPVGVMPGDPRRGGRLSVIDTLRAAVPWQKLRQQSNPTHTAAIHIERGDFRLTRFQQRSQSTTVFVVDASGSAALHRLAEAKGAIELLLADCYVRRDEVALIAFRGESAELLLPPTRSLVRAKRALAGLPGGGGTPLASAIVMATELTEQIKRRGATPGLVFLTDGVANIARDGSKGREQAGKDAQAAAQHLRYSQCKSIVIDTSPRAQHRAKTLAAALDARYVALPHADANRLKQAVQQAGVSG